MSLLAPNSSAVGLAEARTQGSLTGASPGKFPPLNFSFVEHRAGEVIPPQIPPVGGGVDEPTHTQMHTSQNVGL